ncbi:MAG: CpsD/CapB family tyrosine-protein kinase [Rhodobacteraceae bacterium]|nr:CpsD/CapB family tyrosine-protein kinase [Paracoccaceae bacterium]
MEKLEAALAKAREARKAAAAPVGDEIASVGRDRPQAEVAATGNWLALPELSLSKDHARQHRLTALIGGKDATPYDMLRSRTIRMMRESGWQRVAITSPNSACGKSTVAMNLAITMARQTDTKVMLIDLDVRRPSLHKLLGHMPARSFHEVLAGLCPAEEVLVRIGPNLAIATNNSAARQPAELLHSARAAEVLADMSRSWMPDVTIFDMSPMLASDDNVGFMGNVDCALLIAAAESTTLANIDACEKELAQLTNVLGVVLNKCRYSDEAAGYGYENYE